MSNAKIVSLVLAMIAAVALGMTYGARSYFADSAAARDVWGSGPARPQASPLRAVEAEEDDSGGDWQRRGGGDAASGADDTPGPEAEEPVELPESEAPEPDEAE